MIIHSSKTQVTEWRRFGFNRSTLYRIIGLLFAREGINETVATQARLEATPEAVWNEIVLYEEVPGPPPLFLRVFLPYPIRTEGDKTSVGSLVRCVYKTGHLLKRITKVEPPDSLQFEVIDQCLGIERCSLTLGGSYQLHGSGDTTEIVLLTDYQAHLRPRFLWRLVEKLLLGQLHRHILRCVCAPFRCRNPKTFSAGAERLAPASPPRGGLVCTVSQSCSRR